MDRRTMYTTSVERPAIEINKVLRNTYMLLALTLGFSAITAVIAMMIGIGGGMSLVLTLAAFGTLFLLRSKANSAAALPITFLFTGLMGASLGPILNYYVAAGSGALVFQALAGTALIFFTLSAYVLITKKDFSFLGGFLFVGLMIAVIAVIANIFLGMAALSLAINAVILFIMSGFILFDTSRIIHGGETNYVMATVSLYLNIYNIFISLLSLLGASDD
ncbi:Bax inhibitor-1/YccA family protein [Glaciecola sp. 1036]|uniref:Bax inhibitor-1/YccA family protein n=1 Tax=Alteromonadaceae TaxID=72275 RepID=UPI003D00866C